jgi:hypothetical protein
MFKLFYKIYWRTQLPQLVDEATSVSPVVVETVFEQPGLKAHEDTV